MDDKMTVVDPAKIEAGPRDRDVLLPCEEIELAQHCGSGGVQRAAKRRAICLMGMTGENPEHLAAVSRHECFQLRRVARDEIRVVVCRTCQAAAMMEHDERAS